MKRKKIITFAGTRPELIRLSVILKKLDANFEHIFVYTGQNFTSELSDIFFSELKIRMPNYLMNFKFSNLSEFLGQLYIEAGTIIQKETPDAAVILGDTNSGLLAVLLERMNIPVFHMEAGNRCFNSNTPEELNRKVIDRASSYNLVYSEFARRNLINEGFSNEKIFKIGSPMFEVLSYYESEIQNSQVLNEFNLKPQKFIAASFHRQENIDNQVTRNELIKAINLLSSELNVPVILSEHPRLKNLLKNKSGYNSSIISSKPLGFFDWCHLQKNSIITISDSGSVSEESSILGFKAITPRVSIERQEAIETGSILRCNPNYSSVLETAKFVLDRSVNHQALIPKDYLIENTSDRVMTVIFDHLP